MIAYIATGLVHAVIIGALLFNFTSKRETVDAAYAEKVDVVKATTIDESEIKKQQDKLKQKERDKQREKERERKRLEDLKKKSEQEQKRIEELKNRQKLEQKKAEELEQQRKTIALKKQQEEAERKRKAEEARKKKIAEDKRKLARIEREQQEIEKQRRLNESLAAEEAFIAEQRAKQRATTLLSKYSALIKQKVARYRTISPDFERWRTTKVNVKLSPSGDVESVRIVKSSGDVRYDRSVETAIYQSTPLPIPSVAEDVEVNKLFQDLNLDFPMPGT